MERLLPPECGESLPPSGWPCIRAVVVRRAGQTPPLSTRIRALMMANPLHRWTARELAEHTGARIEDVSATMRWLELCGFAHAGHAPNPRPAPRGRKLVRHYQIRLPIHG